VTTPADRRSASPGERRARRCEQRLSGVGDEPDPRFTLANERTFLAWTRTSLALLAAGLAVAELLRSEPPPERLVLAVPCVVLAGVIALTSYRRWETTERALRLGEPLPYSRLLRALSAGVGAIAVAAVVVLITR
jgi:putative membrane protein